VTTQRQLYILSTIVVNDNSNTYVAGTCLIVNAVAGPNVQQRFFVFVACFAVLYVLLPVLLPTKISSHTRPYTKADFENSIFRT
jgi:hypothetical protein